MRQSKRAVSKNILLPDTVSIIDHFLPQAPSFAANALAHYEFPLDDGTAAPTLTDAIPG